MTRRVAITGFSFRFPNTSTPQYWPDLLAGKDLVTTVEPGRWATETYLHPNKNHPGTSYTFAAGSIGDISGFDAGFFGISPREAALMDPQQRLLLELSWEALENAGIPPSSLRGTPCGVYIGISSMDYSFRLTEDVAALDSSVMTGNTLSIAANRISYAFDLQGPSMAIDTACSSSMVAFHQACRSIVSGESNMAMTGGISLHLHPYGFIGFAKASMLSPQGRCKVFDAAGDGYVRSEGGGMFVLKEYEQAVADGDPILAVVAASAVNTDGHKSGLTVPSPEAQANLLRQAYEQAGVDPDAIDYLEAHGTGTAVGDPIETRAIGEALGKARPKDRPLPIGSVKSNMGHLETASGVAGLVKALHCIRHREVPATIGLETLNPEIRLEEWNLEIVTGNRTLDKKKKLVVGVNSFGFGGANAHVVLESHDPCAAGTRHLPTRQLPPLLLSAKSGPALSDMARQYAAFLQQQSPEAYYHTAFSTAFHRDRHEHRLTVSADTPKAAAQALLDYADGKPPTNAVLDTGVAALPSGAAFIYTGNGSQWFGMGKRLLEDPVFLKAVREIDVLFQNHADYSLESELAGDNGDRFEQTEFAQPALFAMQVGITRMLQHRGIQPAAVAGHSVGEAAAAWAAGILSLADAVEVIYHRSRLQGTTKGNGGMTAVALGQNHTQALLEEQGLASRLVIAGTNSSRGITLAGDTDSLTGFETILREREIPHKRLDLDYAFHSPAMDSIECEVTSALASIQPQKFSTPFYSTVTGEKLNGPELGAEYWWHNIRQPVLFEQAIKNIISDECNLFIEIGPHAILSNYIRDALRDEAINGRIIGTISREECLPQRIQSTANQAVIAGANVEWQTLFPYPGSFIELPNYPWQRERHWLPETSESLGLLERRIVHPLLGYPLAQHELVWENQLDLLHHPSLADHVVGESTLFPGSGYVELALAAASAWNPEESLVNIEELEIQSPLLLGEEHSKEIRLRIDPNDGGFWISGREYAGKESWTQHAKGRILAEPHKGSAAAKAPPIPTREPDFDTEAHNRLTRDAGLAYGPAFQGIEQGWVEGDRVLAMLQTPDAIAADMEQMHLHPALLDSTIQLIFQLLKNDSDIEQGTVFIPVKFGRINVRSGLGRPHLASARLIRRAPHSLTADFTIFDQTGAAIAVIQQTRFRAVRLHRGTSDHLSFLDYHAIPKPHPYASNNLSPIRFEEVHTSLTEMAKRNLVQGGNRRYTDEVEPLLDSLCRQFSIEALRQLCGPKDTLSAETISAIRSSTPGMAPFLDYLLNQEEEDQIIVPQGEDWQIQPRAANQPSAQEIWNILVADYPDYFPIIHTVGRIGANLTSILNGGESLGESQTSQVPLSLPVSQVLGAGRKQKLGQVIQDLIHQGQAHLSEGRRLSILEISHQTPLFVMDACLAMDSDHCDYSFATNSTDAQEEVLRLKEHCPGIQCRLIGQESELESILPADLSHLVVVTLDFCDVQKTVQALEFAKAHLAPGGTLLLIGQHGSSWIDFTFGSLPGWFRELEGSWLSNQRQIKFWQQQLQQLGLVCGPLVELSPGSLSDIYFLSARREEVDVVLPPPRQEPSRNWILITDRGGYTAQLSAQLKTQLNNHGDRVVKIFADQEGGIGSQLAEAIDGQETIDGILLLSGLDAHSAQKQGQELLEHEVKRCATAAALFRACDVAQTQIPCWLISVGAMTGLLPGNSARQQQIAASAAADSAFHGFVRSMMNEGASGAIRLIDLETPSTHKELITALTRELEAADSEQEVILTANGERFVPRLRPDSAHGETTDNQDQTTADDAARVYLDFQFPGQLRNLHWQAADPAPLAEDEVEIEVHATGLNFRDLMYALGLLSDEAVENGFAGPSLGLEFAGTVLHAGSKAKGFSSGDKVVGFGPSSFSNRVVTKTSAISHIPPSMSFEAASTIPSVFFTVYYALHYLARLKEGEKVLIHGAAGGIGIAAIQLARSLGAEIYATAGSEEKRDFLRLLGVEHIYDSRSLSFADEILEQTGGQGIDVVLNSLAGEAINRNFQILKPFGRFLELGKRDFYENTKIGLRPFRNNISYYGIDADQLMQEQPELTGALFAEVMALFAEGELHPLPYQVFEAENIVDAFRHMQQARQIGKIVVTYRNGINHVRRPAPDPQEKLTLSQDASYLVTGGLSGFGLKTAQWLVEKGARHLILISRSGPASDEAKAAILQLEQQGVSVLATSCDITDEQALRELLAEVAEKFPPLRGIVHAATVIDDALIRDMDTEQIRCVLAPKILGADYLDRMTQNIPLEFFILFSSATTLFGNPGQANYVAANSWLESLARKRRANGQPATCIRWGAIEDTGYLARNENIKEALQNRMGGKAIQSSAALGILEEFLTTDRSGPGVLEFDWKALNRFLPTADAPKFCELAGACADGASHEQDSISDIHLLLSQLPEPELLDLFIELLKQEIGEILRLSPDKIDANRAIHEMGLDSLMGVELAIAVEARFGIRIPVMELRADSTVTMLANTIINQLKEQTGIDPATNTLAQVHHIAAQHGVPIEAEDAASLASEIQSGKGITIK